MHGKTENRKDSYCSWHILWSPYVITSFWNIELNVIKRYEISVLTFAAMSLFDSNVFDIKIVNADGLYFVTDVIDLIGVIGMI